MLFWLLVFCPKAGPLGRFSRRESNLLEQKKVEHICIVGRQINKYEY